MATRRRSPLPPYEIMRQQQDRPAPVRPPVVGEGDGWWQGVRDHCRGWWPRADEPIVLHVPKGVAVAVLTGLIGLIVLSYWVGHSRGHAAAEARQQARQEDQQNVERPRQAPSLPAVAQGSVDTATRAEARVEPTEDAPTPPSTGADPRQPGLNYLILTTTSPKEAEQLVRFLKPYGVAATAVPSHNARLVQVVALPGFTGDQKGSTAWNEHLRKLRQYGRKWKQHNGGKGSDLGDMYYALYRGG